MSFRATHPQLCRPVHRLRGGVLPATVPRPQPRPLSQPLRVAAAEYEASAHEADSGGEAGANGLFNPQFMSVLQTALQRSGEGALTAGPARQPEPKAKPAEVELIEVSVNHTLDRLQLLERLHKTIEKMIEAEVKQLKRLKFVEEKVGNNAAYTRGLQQMLEDRRDREAGYRGATGSMLEAWDSDEDDVDDPFGTASARTEGGGGGYSGIAGLDARPAPAAGSGNGSTYSGDSYGSSGVPAPGYGSGAASDFGAGSGSRATGSGARAASPLRGRGDGGVSRQRVGSGGRAAYGSGGRVSSGGREGRGEGGGLGGSYGSAGRYSSGSSSRGYRPPSRGRGDGGMSRQGV